MSKYGHKTLNWFEAVVNKLGGEEAAEMFLRGELNLAVPQFAVWKTVKIGVYKNLDAVTTMLTKFKVSGWAKDILGKPVFTLAQVEEEDIDLAVATVKQLTGKDRATTKEIFDAIKRVGDLVPAEVGPALREQYLDQPNGEWLRIAMEPIEDSDGNLSVFSVGCSDSGLWLDANYAFPGSVWGGGDRFIFCPRKVSSVA